MPPANSPVDPSVPSPSTEPEAKTLPIVAPSAGPVVPSSGPSRPGLVTVSGTKSKKSVAVALLGLAGVVGVLL